MGPGVSGCSWLNVDFTMCTHGVWSFRLSTTKCWLYKVYPWGQECLAIHDSMLTFTLYIHEARVILNVHDSVLTLHYTSPWGLVFLAVYDSMLTLHCAWNWLTIPWCWLYNVQSCYQMLLTGFIQFWPNIEHIWDMVFLGNVWYTLCTHENWYFRLSMNQCLLYIVCPMTCCFQLPVVWHCATMELVNQTFFDSM